MSALIRRTAISTSARHECAGLTGGKWLEYLDHSVNGAPFTDGIGRLLANAPYQKLALSDLEITELTRLCEDWLNAQNKRKK